MWGTHPHCPFKNVNIRPDLALVILTTRISPTLHSLALQGSPDRALVLLNACKAGYPSAPSSVQQGSPQLVSQLCAALSIITQHLPFTSYRAPKQAPVRYKIQVTRRFVSAVVSHAVLPGSGRKQHTTLACSDVQQTSADRSAIETAIDNARSTCEGDNSGACANAWDDVSLSTAFA